MKNSFVWAPKNLFSIIIKRRRWIRLKSSSFWAPWSLVKYLCAAPSCHLKTSQWTVGWKVSSKAVTCQITYRHQHNLFHARKSPYLADPYIKWSRGWRRTIGETRHSTETFLWFDMQSFTAPRGYCLVSLTLLTIRGFEIYLWSKCPISSPLVLDRSESNCCRFGNGGVHWGSDLVSNE